MASTAALHCGQLLYTSLVQSGTITPAAPAIISPLSVWFALVLLLNGSGIPSTTHNQLFAVLSGSSPVGQGNSTEALRVLNDRAAGLHGVLTGQSSDDNKLIIANALWTKSLNLIPSYPAQMKALFGAEVASVQGISPINSWASRVTNGLMSQVVPPGLDFNLLITNAAYFKGLWEYPFDKSRTKQQAFKQ